MRNLLRALTHRTPPSSTSQQPPTRRRTTTPLWRLIPVALVFSLALTLVAQTNHPTASAQTPPAVAIEKLDPYLQLLVAPPQPAAQRSQQPGLLGAAPAIDHRPALADVIALDFAARVPTVDVLIETSGPDSELQSQGARVLGRIGNIVALRVPIAAVPALSNLPSVSRIEASVLLHPLNDNAAEDIGATQARTPTPGYDGSGVVVAILDSGIDIFHQDFRDAAGKTRVKALLDLTVAGPGPGGGTVYTEAQINTELDNPGTTVPQRDTGGHGSHVAGSAAGDGSSTDTLGQYAGIAPRADLVVVKGVSQMLSSTALLAALQFVDDQAAILAEPWVANLSFGTNVGPHDGTSLLEQALDTLTGPSNPGQVIVVAAGNEGDDITHARTELILPSPGGTLPAEFRLEVPSGQPFLIVDVWYDGDTTAQTGWITPSGSGVLYNGNPYPVGTNEVKCEPSPSDTITCVTVYHSSNLAQNGDKNMYFFISRYDLDSNVVAIEPGTWKFHFGATAIAGGSRLDAYSAIEYCGGCYFSSPTVPAARLRSPGTANNAITVGSYVTDTAVWGGTLGAISGFSSPGPTRDGRIKPEIIAPGQAIASTRSADSPGSSTYIYKQGTSMASPMVTGAVALLLQADPTLDSSEVRTLLTSTARTDAFTGATPNTLAGYGKLDVLAALGRLFQTDPDASIAVGDDSAPADGTTTALIGVQLKTSDGKNVVGHTVSVAGDPATSTITPLIDRTRADGIAIFHVTSSTDSTVTYTFTDTTDDVTITDTQTITFGDGGPGEEDLTLSSLTISAGTLTPTFDPATTSYTATVPNDVTSIDVTATPTDPEAWLTINDDTFENGVPKTIPLAEGENIIGIVVSGQTETSSPITYTVIVSRAPPPGENTTDPDRSTIVAQDSQAEANGVATGTIRVRLLDSASNPVSGHDVTLGQDGSSTISGGGSGITDAGGYVFFTVTSMTVETVTYTATDTTDGVTVTNTTKVFFTKIETSQDDSTVVASDTTVAANGVALSTITVSLVDSLGNPMVGHDVALSQGDGSSSISDGGIGTTDAAGQVTFGVTNATVETVTYNATDTTQGIILNDTAHVDFVGPSTDATLSALALSAGTLAPAFAPGTTSYTASVANDVNSIDVTATTADSAATLTIDGSPATSGAPEGVSLAVGPNPIEVIVTADDGSTELTYTVTVTRAEPPISTDATLAALTLSTGTLAPTFAPGSTSYSATVANAVTSINVTATTTDGSATLTIDGAPTTSGSPRSVSLSVGANPIPVVVTAEDGSTELTYTVTVTRAAPAASSDADLSALALSPGTLAPAFAPATTSYTASVANDVNSIDITATTNDSAATLTIDGSAATSGNSASVALSVGANPIPVVVTAEDGSTELTYTITVTRAAPDDGGGGGGFIFIPPPPPPTVRVDLTLTNDDGGEATLEDFIILVDDLTELTVGEIALLTYGGHLVSITGPTAFYSIEFGGACFEDGTVILLGGLAICSVHLDDQPLAAVLSAPLGGLPPLIDESLSLTADAFERDGIAYVEASSPGTPPEVTIAVPVDAIPGAGTITILVSPANELAIGQNPPPGSLLIGGTAYVIQILDADGNPVTEFDLPLQISFLLPAGSGPIDAYSFDPDLGRWVLEPGTTTGGRFQVTPNHLTTFALFGIGAGGGLNGAPPSRGIWLTTAEGGSVTQLGIALRNAGATGAFVTHHGEWIGYLPAAPDFVNQRFHEFFATGIPPGQVFLISMD